MCLMQYKNLKNAQAKQYYKKANNDMKKLLNLKMEVNKILIYFFFRIL